MDSWHLDGFGFYVVGYGNGKWRAKSRSTYKPYDPVVRSYCTSVPERVERSYAYLDNPGMWNLRSQQLKNWYLGEELYVRVYDADPNPAKEKPSPNNILLCENLLRRPRPLLAPAAPPPKPSSAPSLQITAAGSHIAVICIVANSFSNIQRFIHFFIGGQNRGP
ncbi:hypothetical protein M0R45_034005 [Rubus argutus]|uniref:Plastocyanin-like domain-containing protein n=1 Tax=Rubus argutus TaxID=59490 RepID=A0AAW1VT18_RUBAR